MADNPGHYNFDFKKEAEDLRRGLGANATNMLFVELDIKKSGNNTPHIHVGHMIGNQRFKNAALMKIKMDYKDDPDASSEHVLLGDGDVIIFRKNEQITATFGEKNRGLLELFSLYHETGHALIPGGHVVDDTHPYRECAADAYAALRLFQRFGREAAPILSMISWNRSYSAFTGDSQHLTTTVLDKIILDGRRRDFSKLTSGEIIGLAKAYADEWTPKPAVLSDARKHFGSGNQLSLSMISKTCLSSSNDFAFYIGAKFFQPLLKPEGIVLNGHVAQPQPEKRRQYASLIKDRAAGLHLQDIFSKTSSRNKRYDPSLAAALKVTRPAGQNKFIVNDMG